MASNPYDGMSVPMGDVPPPPAPPVAPPAPVPYEPWLQQVPYEPWHQQQPPVTAAPPGMRSRWQKASTVGAAGLAAFWKFKVLALLLKLKFLTFAGSMMISFAAYALFYGWTFGLGLVVLLAVHEFGHVIMLRARGVKTTMPVFVPMLGAFVKGAPTTVYNSALGSLAGPGLGAVGAFVAWEIWNQGGPEVYRALGAFGFFMNLFNLVPIPFLDGGHVLTALTGKLSNGKGSARMYGLSKNQRILVWGLYLGLILVLAVATKSTYFHRNLS